MNYNQLYIPHYKLILVLTCTYIERPKLYEIPSVQLLICKNSYITIKESGYQFTMIGRYALIEKH